MSKLQKKEADKAKRKAKIKAAEDLDDAIKKRKKACKANRKAMAAEIARLQRALEIGQKLKIFDDDGGKRANTMKQVNDKIWDAAQDLAQDHTAVTVDSKGNIGIANDETADLISLDPAQDITEGAVSAMKMLMQCVGDFIGAAGVPDVGQDQLLGGLKALAHAVQNQVNTLRNPTTWLARNNQSPDLRRNAESYNANKMKDMGIGRNAAERAEINKTITELYEKPSLISNLIIRSGQQAARCAKDINDMEARRAGMKK